MLGDRIAIMANGRMRVIGNSIHLKQKFGAGYRISLSCFPLHTEAVTTGIKDVLAAVNESDANEQVSVDEVSSGGLMCQFPASRKGEIPAFVKWLERNESGLMTAWGISQTTLEEVFLRIIREAKDEKSKNELG